MKTRANGLYISQYQQWLLSPPCLGIDEGFFPTVSPRNRAFVSLWDGWAGNSGNSFFEVNNGLTYNKIVYFKFDQYFLKMC